ncbi:hypothetical protein JKP88DRAFT_318404 [Tribonema minus]|uniref:Uncharacterized protein n=1 Tax=Tribonema minus TaxID=303371 RepID=A0A835YW21_9STRA|nr:hypothetical protein JKP88DRAFT_318404 [Tribonema minus]
MPQAGWGDLTDADIWGDQKETSKGGAAGAPKSPTSDDEADWSDDDDASASVSETTASRSPGASPARPSGGGGGGGGGAQRGRQLESDHELAMKLQKRGLQLESNRVKRQKARPMSDSVTTLAAALYSNMGLFCEEEARAAGRTTASASPQRAAGADKPDGECLARISKRTLLVKAWKPTYFIFELADLLLLYRSREDYIYHPKGTCIKKRIEIRHSHTLTPLKRKYYKDYGYLWHFTMEEQMDYGPAIVAKFAYQDKRPLEELGNKIAEGIREKRRTRARLSQYSYGGGHAAAASRSASPPPSAIYNATASNATGEPLRQCRAAYLGTLAPSQNLGSALKVYVAYGGGHAAAASRSASPPPSAIYNATASNATSGGVRSYGNSNRYATSASDYGGSARSGAAPPPADGGDKYSRWGTISE